MEEGGRELTIGSAYLPFDSKGPLSSKKVRKLVVGYRSQVLSWYCVNSNPYRIIWGSTGINKRGESLLEFIISYEKPTICGSVTVVCKWEEFG